MPQFQRHYLKNDANLKAFWGFDHSSGNATDSSGNNNTLTNNNSIPYVRGKFNQCADLESGSSQYFSIANGSQTGLGITGDLSIITWVNFESLPASGDGMTYVGKFFDTSNQRSYIFHLNNSGGTLQHRFAYSSDGTFQAGNALTVSWTPVLSIWYQVGVSFKASTSTVKFYTDGLQVGANQTGSNTSIFNSTADVYVGALQFSSGNTWYMDGKIFDTLIFNRELTAGEFKSVFNNGNDFNNYKFVSAGDGISVTEKIR